MADDLEALLQHSRDAAGEMRELIQDNRQTIEDVIENLRDAAQYAREFAREIMEQPQALVRGAKPQGRQSP